VQISKDSRTKSNIYSLKHKVLSYLRCTILFCLISFSLIARVFISTIHFHALLSFFTAHIPLCPRFAQTITEKHRTSTFAPGFQSSILFTPHTRTSPLHSNLSSRVKRLTLSMIIQQFSLQNVKENN